MSAPYLTSRWDQDIVDFATKQLDVEKCRMMIASKDELEGKKYDLKERWYGTEYTIVPISDKLLKVRSSLFLFSIAIDC